MSLNEKISSLTSGNTVANLSSMLESAETSISWWGQRKVSIDGYKDSVTIDELASKYLEAAPFKRKQDVYLQGRLDCENLWKKFQQVYDKSDESLSKTWLYRFLIPLIEFRIFGRSPQMIIKEENSAGKYYNPRKNIFEIPREKFIQVFGEEHRNGSKTAEAILATTLPTWRATRKMVEAALKA